MPHSMVEMRNVMKKFDQQTAVHKLSLSIRKGEFITLLGPSGCGKTTTLRLIAGFEQPTSGDILLDGEHVEGKPPYLRNLNTVFQNYALFPHLSAFENVAFGLRVKKVAKKEVEQRVRKALSLVQLEEYADRKPDQLSGGQKQRVAIARALVNNPKVLLLDEPLGALDQKLRKQMQIELKHLQKQLGITFIFVTHDQEEALTMSDRIAVMNQGNLEQVGTPDEIYDRPRSKFVAEFIGEMNMLQAVVKKSSQNILVIDFRGMTMLVPPTVNLQENERITIAIRPERTTLSLERDDSNQLVQLSCRLEERIYCGLMAKTIVLLPSGEKLISHEKTDNLVSANPGDELFIRWNPEHMVVLTG